LFKVIKILAVRETLPILQADPRIAFKYLYQYLGTDLSQSERVSILINHYTFLKDRVKRRSSRGLHGFFRTIVGKRIKLWEHAVSNHHFRISVTFPGMYHYEGDLSLVFQIDHVDIYTLSFTIGPGSVAGLTVEHAIYIGRVQGKGKGLQLIREATKECLDISPDALLLAATEGIAQALELGHIVGIGADGQISAHNDSRPERLVNAYDEFWMASGGVRLVRNMYHLGLPVPEKPIQAIQSKHRSRTLRKRAFKNLVKEQVRREFSAAALRPRNQ
jgi:uncharacterized protein VirK/YbjX